MVGVMVVTGAVAAVEVTMAVVEEVTVAVAAMVMTAIVVVVLVAITEVETLLKLVAVEVLVLPAVLVLVVLITQVSVMKVAFPPLELILERTKVASTSMIQWKEPTGTMILAIKIGPDNIYYNFRGI